MGTRQEFKIVESITTIEEGWGVATVSQAKMANVEVLLKIFSSMEDKANNTYVRLKNGYINYEEDEHKFTPIDSTTPCPILGYLKYKLITNEVQTIVTEEDGFYCALDFALQSDDVDGDLKDMLAKVNDAKAMLSDSKKIGYFPSIAHACAHYMAVKTLAVILHSCPDVVNATKQGDVSGMTPLHYMMDNISSRCSMSPSGFVGAVESGEYVEARAKKITELLLGNLAKCQNPNIRSLVNQVMSITDYSDDNRTVLGFGFDKGDSCRAGIKGVLEGAEEILKNVNDNDKQLPKWLLKLGDKKDLDMPALHRAVENVWPDVVGAILQYAASQHFAEQLVSIKNNSDGDTPLHILLKLEMLEWENESKVPNRSTIYSSLFKHMTPDTAKAKNNSKQTILHLATSLTTWTWPIEYYDILLSFESPIYQSIYERDNKGQYPLTNAYFRWTTSYEQPQPQSLIELHKDVVHLLLNCIKKKVLHIQRQSQNHNNTNTSANQIQHQYQNNTSKGALDFLTQKFELGLTTLHVASGVDYDVESIRFFCQSGAKLDSKTDNGMTPLHFVSQSKFRKSAIIILKTLVGLWKDEKKNTPHYEWINTRDKSKFFRTALHYSVDHEYVKTALNRDYGQEICRYLLECNSDKTIKDNAGQTTLHIAVKRGNVEVVTTLIPDQDVMKDLDFMKIADLSGQTALHIAAKKGHKQIVELLLGKPSKLLLEKPSKAREARYKFNQLLRIRDNKLKTPFYLAIENRNTKIAKVMLNDNALDKKIKNFLRWNARSLLPNNDFPEPVNAPSLKDYATNEDIDIVREMVNAPEGFSSMDEGVYKWLMNSLGSKASDQPTYEDNLERRSLVHGIANLLLNPFTKTPITIGIFGGWGLGKSSFMLQVEHALIRMAITETFKCCPEEKFRGRFGNEVNKLLKHYMQQKENTNHQHWKCNILKLKKMFQKEVENEELKSLSIELDSQYQRLFKNLALVDKSNLVMLPTTNAKKWFTPTILTVRYNVWQYNTQIEASAGLAVEVCSAMEDSMTPAQWLRMCWEYSWEHARGDIFLQLFLPMMIACVVVIIIIVIWKQTHIDTKYKYLSLPVGILGIIWPFYKGMIEVVQPVAQVIRNTITHPDNSSNLGYHHKVIYDINFVKAQLCKDAGILWFIIGLLLQLFAPNKSFFIKKFTLLKQSPKLSNFRIVVFIDDLDRCQEQNVLELLQTVNLILGSCGISALIGVDKTMLTHAIAKEFFKNVEVANKLLDTLNEDEIIYTTEQTNAGLLKMKQIRHRVERYIEKIIQIPVNLPELSNETLHSFLNGQLGASFSKLEKCSQPTDMGSQPHDDNTRTNNEESQPPNMEAQRCEVNTTTINVELQPPDMGSQPREVNRNSSNTTTINVELQPTDMGSQSREGNTITNNVELQPPDMGSQSREDPFILSLPRYTLLEMDTLKKLCEVFMHGEKESPREWKRFLYYHQQAWTILSNDPEVQTMNDYIGWERKLLLWIFVCWHWRHEMDYIFENWVRLKQKYITKQNNEDFQHLGLLHFTYTNIEEKKRMLKCHKLGKEKKRMLKCHKLGKKKKRMLKCHKLGKKKERMLKCHKLGKIFGNL